MNRFHRTVRCLALWVAFTAPGSASLVRPTVSRFEPPTIARKTGLERFVFDDFGLLDVRNERTGTLPWKLVATALVLFEAKPLGLQPDREALASILERFGLFVPEVVANWPQRAGLAPAAGKTIAQARGLAGSRLGGLGIELRSPGCPLCHSGVLYDANGLPTRSVWLGILDLSGEGDPGCNLASSACSGQSPPAGPQWSSGLRPLRLRALAYDKPLCTSLDSFTLHAATRAGGLDAEGREAFLRYVLRPPIAQERAEQRPDGFVARLRALDRRGLLGTREAESGPGRAR